MVATATVPERALNSVPEEAGEPPYYALSFGSAVAQLWFVPSQNAVAPSSGRGYHESDLVCGMLGARAELLARLWQDGLLSKLIDAGLLAAMEPTQPSARRYSFTLRLSRTPAISFGYEWCAQMWKDATLTVIDLMAALATCGFTLRQPNPLYVLFDGPNPVYINPGSIAPLNEMAWHGAVDRLVRGFLYPIHFCSKGQDRLARTLQRSLYGIQPEDFAALSEMERNHLQDRDGSTPENFLQRLKAEVEGMEVPYQEMTRRGEHASDPPLKPCERWGHTHWAVHRTLRELQPRTVLALPCGSGWFARLAALEGAEVIAADPDETCVSHVYQQARQERGHVLPLVFDLVDPSPGIGLLNHSLPPATERLRADLVVALDTVHHLMLSGLRLSFDQVVAGFAALARRWLLVEFVLVSEGNGYDLANRPDCASWYNLDRFTHALERRFKHVSMLPSPLRTRMLLLCTK